jgi:hypothetical protein
LVHTFPSDETPNRASQVTISRIATVLDTKSSIAVAIGSGAARFAAGETGLFAKKRAALRRPVQLQNYPITKLPNVS